MTQTPTQTGPWRAKLKSLASPAILFFALPWLMVLLTAGTIAQRDLGLYEAQKQFFSSWILWAGFIPLPGAYLTLGAISVCLLAKFLLYSPWRVHQAGIILTHLGVLVLLIGGIITAYSQQEGFLPVKEGSTVNSVSDYHARTLTIRKDEEIIGTIPFDTLQRGSKLGLDLPFTVTVEALCSNCRPAPADDPANRHGLAEQIILTEAPADKTAETNLSGVTLVVSGADEAQNGVYVTMEEIPHKPSVTVDGATYDFSMGRAQRVLPFSLELKDFERSLHPGTDTARAFSSQVIVHDGAVAWPYTIRMNEPLRYKGYTLYQASFSIKPDGEYSVLSVVTNKGRIFPYLSSAMIFAGLLLHVVIRLKGGKGRGA